MMKTKLLVLPLVIAALTACDDGDKNPPVVDPDLPCVGDECGPEQPDPAGDFSVLLMDDMTGDKSYMRFGVDAAARAKGSLSVNIMVDSADAKLSYITLFGSSTSTANAVLDLKMGGINSDYATDVSEGETIIKLRAYDAAGNKADDIETGIIYPGSQWVNVNLDWDKALDSVIITVSELDGAVIGTYSAAMQNQLDVEKIQFTISDTSGVTTTEAPYYVDDIIVKDSAGEEVFTDGFSSGALTNDYTVSGAAISDAEDAGQVEGGEPTDPEVPEPTGGQSAKITDTSTADTGELRYKLPAGQSTGKVSLSFLYEAAEEETLKLTLFDTQTKEDYMIGQVRFDEGKIALGDSTDTDATFTPGEWVDVEMAFDTTDLNDATYNLTVNGTYVGEWTAKNAAEVTHISLMLSSNGGVAKAATYIDNFKIFSDADETSVVFEDDFEGYAEGTSLSADPYNSSTFSVEVSDEKAVTPEEPAPAAGQSAMITDTSTADTGELRYKFPAAQTTGKVSLSFLYEAAESETLKLTLFDTETSESSSIGQIRFDEGDIALADKTDTGASFTPGSWVDVELSFDTSDVNAATYSLTVDGVEVGEWPATNANPVTHVSLMLSSNGGTAKAATYIDNFKIFSDAAETSVVFKDDFEDYEVTHDLSADPYNSSTFSVVVTDKEAVTAE